MVFDHPLRVLPDLPFPFDEIGTFGILPLIYSQANGKIKKRVITHPNLHE